MITGAISPGSARHRLRQNAGRSVAPASPNPCRALSHTVGTAMARPRSRPGTSPAAKSARRSVPGTITE
jgi:hypothetical protein